MTSRHRLGRQLGPLITGRVGAAAVSAMWFAVMVRQLGILDIGDLVLLLAIHGVVSIVVADAGLPTLLAEQASRDPRSVRSALAIVVRRRLLLGVAAAAAIGGIYTSLANDTRLAIPMLFSISVLSTTVYTSVTAAMRATGHAAVDGTNELVSRLFVLAAGWWWLSHGGGLAAAVTTYVVADLASAVTLAVIALRLFGPSQERVDPAHLSWRRAGPLAISNAATVAFYRSDILILAALTSGRTVAIYAAAYRLLDGILLPGTAVAALVVPSVAARPVAERCRVTARLARTALLLTIPLVAATLAFARPLLGIVFGPRYEVGSGVLRLLVLAALPSAMAMCYAQFFAVAAGPRLARVSLSVLAVNLVVDGVLISAVGVTGAALATVVVQVLFLVLLLAGGRTTVFDAVPPRPLPDEAALPTSTMTTPLAIP